MFQRQETRDNPEKPGTPMTVIAPDEERVFMNSWNVKQVIVVEGTIPITQSMTDLVHKLKESDLIPKVVHLTENEVRDSSIPRIAILSMRNEAQ